MSQLEELKELRHKINSGSCTINDLKNMYENVNTKQEVIVAEKGDIKHLYYRDNKTKTVIPEKSLIPYEKILYGVEHHVIYPLDLCNITFYNEDTNRYGQGIIIPRIKKFVMIDDLNLIKEPLSKSFCTKGVKENNEGCLSIVDKMGNIYRIFGYGEENKAFTFENVKVLNPMTVFYEPYGTLLRYNGNCVYAEIRRPPYIIFDKESLKKYVGSIANISDDIEKFDDSFMQGHCYTKK